MSGRPARWRSIGLQFLLPAMCMPQPGWSQHDAGSVQPAELVAIARIPGDQFVPGPVSGQFIDPQAEPGLDKLLPFRLGQPLQGFSAVVKEGESTFLALADNGYGARANSADFVLTVYRIRPDFRTHSGGSGTIAVESAIRLRDPMKQAQFERVADSEWYPPADAKVPVDPAIRRLELLTGADFDPESLQRLRDGSFWIGDEFGPWLLHFDIVGRLLQAPAPLPGVSGPDNVLVPGEAHLAVRSGGFEGMAWDREQNLLYPMLEKPLEGGGADLNIYVFDPQRGAFLDRPPLRYPLEQGARAAGDIQSLGNGGFLVLERDGEQGDAARIKRVYRVQEGRVDADGRLRKELVADLLEIADPHGLAAGTPGSSEGRYRFSFETIESLVVLGKDRLGVVNDNNYPFGNGPGGAGDDLPEATVFIILDVPALK